MASSSPTQNLVTDIWVKASWEEFMALADNPDYEKGRFYYEQGYCQNQDDGEINRWLLETFSQA